MHDWNLLLPSGHADSFARDHLPPADQWPVFDIAGAALDYPDWINCGQELVDRHVQAGKGERIAIRGMAPGPDAPVPVAWTYGQLMQQCHRIAQVLTVDMGLVPGNRVLLRGANTPMMAACFLAAWQAGLVVVPTMPMLRAAELSVVIEKAQICAALCDAALLEELQHCMAPEHVHYQPVLRTIMPFRSLATDALEARMQVHSGPYQPERTSRDDVCLIAFTSGTTGKPKGTMHFHRDVLAMCDLFPRSVLQMGPEDVVCGTPPLAFTFGLGGLLTFALRHGASTVLLERHTAESLLQAIETYGATQCYTAPTMYRQMAALLPHYDVSRLQHPVSAGEALPPATRAAWTAAGGPEICDGIGGTEVIHIYIASAGAQVREGTIGKVVAGYTAQVVDAAMQPVPPGTPGRLAVRGPTGCRYLQDTRQKEYVAQGWNLPGDTFVMDADGYFRYCARNDDMIISAGYNIAGPEVEGVLLQHTAVMECAVVGMPDTERGQIVQAFVVLKTGHRRDAALVLALQEYVKSSIAPFKYPRKIVFMDALPRTETGKLQRYKLRQLAN